MKYAAALMTVILVLGARGTIPADAQQPGDCRPAGGAPAGFQGITVGHFSEGTGDVFEFCRYLIRQRIWPSFQDLGSVRNPNAAQRAHDALETGAIDVLWVNSHVVGAILESNRALRLKVVAFTDFLALHVGTRQAGVQVASDPAFSPPEVAVRTGRSMFFADVLFGTLHLKPRCLEMAIGCTVLPGEGLATEFDRFLTGGARRAVVLASWALPPKGPDAVVRSLHTGEFHLIGVPPATVVSMQSMAGTLAILQIPRGVYGPTQRADVATAAMTQMLVSSTPPEVQMRVNELAGRLNNALLDTEPRIDVLRDLPVVLAMARELEASTAGRLAIHPELSRLLQRHGLLESPLGPPDTERTPKEPICRPRDEGPVLLICP